MKKLFMIVLIGAMVLTGALTATAGNSGYGHKGENPGHGHKGDGKGPGGFLKNLNLSDAQKGEIAAILSKYRDEHRNLMDNFLTAKENVYAAIHADAFNENDVRQAFQAASAIKEEMVVLRAKVFSEIKPILTPEQLEKLKAQRKERKEKMKERREDTRSRFDEWLESNADTE